MATVVPIAEREILQPCNSLAPLPFMSCPNGRKCSVAALVVLDRLLLSSNGLLGGEGGGDGGTSEGCADGRWLVPMLQMQHSSTSGRMTPSLDRTDGRLVPR